MGENIWKWILVRSNWMQNHENLQIPNTLSISQHYQFGLFWLSPRVSKWMKPMNNSLVHCQVNKSEMGKYSHSYFGFHTNWTRSFLVTSRVWLRLGECTEGKWNWKLELSEIGKRWHFDSSNNCQQGRNSQNFDGWVSIAWFLHNPTHFSTSDESFFFSFDLTSSFHSIVGKS
jgi:hypothetical protein